MTDLVSRLLEAIGETERLALIAKDDTEGEWGPSTWGVAATSIVLYDKSGRLAVGSVSHIERHDPSSVLRRCAADRKLIEHIQDQWDAAYGEPGTVLPHEWATALRILAEAYGLEVTE